MDMHVVLVHMGGWVARQTAFGASRLMAHLYDEGDGGHIDAACEHICGDEEARSP